ncbi:MAG: Rieske (2Fe-2S) protein [Bryobacteraceae bacterium]|nr:Rieske (2Fe-2S) protein [Bryobacteraceae bacterium]
MPLVKVASRSQLPPGALAEAKVGETTLVLCHAQGEIHALDGLCPHREGPLAHGALHENWIVCPWHAWEFDCLTGSNDYRPEIKLRKFAVVEDGDDILVEVPESSA